MKWIEVKTKNKSGKVVISRYRKLTKRSIYERIHQIQYDRHNYNNGKYTFPTPTPTKPTLHTQATEDQKTQQYSNRSA